MRWTLVLFSLRVPLACGLALALLAPLGAFSFSPFRGMLEGLFDVSGWGAFWAGLSSGITAAACWLCALLNLNYGPSRLPGMRRVAPRLEFRLYPSLALAFALAPVSLLAGVRAVSTGGGLALVAESAAGLGVSLLGWRLLTSLHLRPGRASRWVRLDRTGYVNDLTGELLPGHWLAVQFAAGFVTLWALIGLLKYLALKSGSAAVMLPSSLSFVALLIGLLALSLGGIAFFFDRYRIPVLLPWAALLAVNSVIPSADHFVAAVPPAAGPRLAPINVLHGGATPVLVCASGGGIASAAWTAQVLSGLDRLNPGRFTPSIVLFSGASGGSVGGMHFLAACRSNRGRGCADAFRRASQSSLDAAAWGLAGPDLVRAVVPFAGSLLGDIGRGWALERAWDPSGSLHVPLTAWPSRPAIVLNSTLVETGEGIGLSNIDLGRDLPGLISLLNKRAQFKDITVVSAARLSASFPLVTPAPRQSDNGYHFADGGYYDNYGVGAAVAFLEQAYLAPRARAMPNRLLLIEIRASASNGRRAPASASAPLFQWLSPAHTMLNVRDTAQRKRNDTTLSLLTQALAARGVTLERVQFENPRSDVPLSWHLTARQNATLTQDWRHRFETSHETAKVAAFLSQHQ